jgi:membrane protease YdiL (CAAX protease family)
MNYVMENHQMNNNAKETSLTHRIFSHPLSRIIFETVLFFGPLVILKIVLIKPGLRLFGFDENVFLAFQGILTIAAMFTAYIAIMKWYEKRSVNELSPKFVIKDGLSGILAGAGMVSVVFAILWLAGAWYIISVGSISAMIVPVIWVFVLALWEELIFRGVIYRILEEWLGTILALVLSAAFFGGLHIFNDNADLLSVLSATSGGLLMGALYSLTGRLWIPIFFHASWNLTQAIFGSVVSGSDLFGTYFVSVREGPEWLTGGLFGVENSLITVSLMFMVVAIIFLYMKKQSLFLARGGILNERMKHKTGE